MTAQMQIATAPDPGAVIAEAQALIAAGGAENSGAGLRLLCDLGDADPNDAVLQFRVGKALCDVQTYDLAYRFLKQAVVLDTANGRSWKMFATCLFAMKQYQAAKIAIDRALATDPDDPVSNLVLGRILFFLEDNAAADAAYDRAIDHARDPGLKAKVLLEKGQNCEAVGDMEAARDLYHGALEVRPDYINAYAAYAGTRAKFDDPEAVISRLEEAMAEQQPDNETRAMALFTIGGIHAGQKRHDEAFASFEEGNRLRGVGRAYRHDNVVALFDRLKAFFTPALLSAWKDFGDPSARHVFIVGMPRSGTTLTESILARHPQVRARGERPEMARIGDALWGRSTRHVGSEGQLVSAEGAECTFGFAAEDRPELAALRDTYIATLSAGLSDDVTRITDKLPLNFVHLGLISVFFPNARIVHCVRDPMDTCSSCFLQNFSDNLVFTHDLTSLGLYYRAYQDLMQHWKAVLPNPILDFHYEEIVSDPEAMARTLIEHVGLGWNEACLGFDEADYQVRTASAWQVRQKIYSSSVGSWRRYEKHMAPLRQALSLGD